MNRSATAVGPTSRRRRLALLLIVVLGLAPVTWIRSAEPWQSSDRRQVLAIEPLPAPALDFGRVTVAGAWRLESPNLHFGGYSALVPLDDGTLLAASDRGDRLRFTPPGREGPQPSFASFRAGDERDEKRFSDIEALTRDPVRGTIWAAYEGSNMIERHDRDLRPQGRVQPVAMRSWPGNGGPEAMVRLADGRFLVLAESSTRWFADEAPALLFPDDPADGASPLEFRFAPPAGYRPVDVAQLPDGRVLILVRRVKWGLPPRFAGKLVLADPTTIRPGVTWRGETVAELDDPLPTDNYEGLAIEPQADGSAVLWLISDDNTIRPQRTLLLKMLWRPNGKARRTSRAPR